MFRIDMFWAKEVQGKNSRQRKELKQNKQVWVLSGYNMHMISLSSQGKGERLQCKIRSDAEILLPSGQIPLFIFAPLLKQPGFCLSFSDVFSSGWWLRGFENQPVQTCLQKFREVKQWKVCKSTQSVSYIRLHKRTFNILNPQLN